MKSLKFNALMISTLTAMLVIGCSNTTAPTGLQNNETGSVVVEKYVYLDKQYEISYNKVGDEIKMLDGPDNAAVADLMANSSSGFALDPKETNTLWIYKNADELKNIVDLIDAKYGTKALAKKAGQYAHALLWEHDNRNGTSLVVNYSTSSLPTFNDKASALEFWSSEVCLYEHANYGGHSLYLYPVYYSGYGYYKLINSLSAYPMYGSVNWNDKVSSVAVYPY